MTLTEVEEIGGSEGDFSLLLRRKPRYVDPAKCMACGLCAEKCPKKIKDLYNEGLSRQKAIHVPYPQAVPLAYLIDGNQCFYLQVEKCRLCETVCPAGAIDFSDTEKRIHIHVGSIILATGFQPYNPAGLDHYSYHSYSDVVTSLEFERILSAGGPFSGEILLPSCTYGKNKQTRHARNIAWLQCVGSRDINRSDNEYCSSVCCMHAIKQALIAREHGSPAPSCTIFYNDIRTHGKNFERYFEKARQLGIRFIPSRIHTIEQTAGDQGMRLRFVDECGKPASEYFDLIVLSTGLTIPNNLPLFLNAIGVNCDHHGFIVNSDSAPLSTSVPGIFACGMLTGPKDIPESVVEASAAACAATEKLAATRHQKTTKKSTPEEQAIERLTPRIGVFICRCGTNISKVVRVSEVADTVKELPYVVYVEENLFTCSQDTQDKISQVIREKKLNRIVVAACSPLTHERLFQETLIEAGLNRHLVEMANIRNHDSWVHATCPDEATEKAKDLVRMAVAKSALLSPLKQHDLPVEKSALVVGGGVAGMTASLSLARHGFPVALIERTDRLGGFARKLYITGHGTEAARIAQGLVEQIAAEPLITVHLQAQLSEVDGFVGNFVSKLRQNGVQKEIKHGVSILATGAREFQPDDFLYGSHPAVMTHLEMDALLQSGDDRIDKAEVVAFIQCVGSRETTHPYCSRVCCIHTMTSALELKKRNPDVQVTVFYRDIRTYGRYEQLYKQARRSGVLFFRYTPENKPLVSALGRKVAIEAKDVVLNKTVCVHADMLCLATALEPHQDAELYQMLKVACDQDGWLMEAHQKLRPVDFAVEGVFLCGMAHYPKPLDECVAQALAAASRALKVLTSDTIAVGGVVARIDGSQCSGCLSCIEVCPYKAISIDEKEKVPHINEALCKACGSCSATCPSEAIILEGFTHRQVYAQIAQATKSLKAVEV